MSVSEQELAQAVAELRERVRRAAVESPARLTPLQRAVSEVNANWHLSARLPAPRPGAPLLWRMVYFVKRVIRRVMVEALNTLVEQQNAMNGNVARAVTELAKENAELRARVAELEKQVPAK